MKHKNKKRIIQQAVVNEPIETETPLWKQDVIWFVILFFPSILIVTWILYLIQVYILE